MSTLRKYLMTIGAAGMLVAIPALASATAVVSGSGSKSQAPAYAKLAEAKKNKVAPAPPSNKCPPNTPPKAVKQLGCTP